MVDALRLIDHPLVATLGWTLTHFLWQGALLGLTAFFVLRVVRPTQSSTRYLVGVVTLAAMVLVPVATFISTAGQTASSRRQWNGEATRVNVSSASLITGAIVANPEGNPAAIRELLPAGAQTAAHADPAPIAPVWLPLVTAIWMVGVGVLSLRMLGGWMLTQLLARRAVRAVATDVESAAREMARRLQLHRSFRVLESAAVTVPTLVGWIQPVVLLPAAALAGLSPLQLQAVIAHELAHIRRHDYLVNLLQTAVETLLFYHPAVWWVSAEIRAEREHCCDDLAVKVCGDRLVYVSALAELTSMERRAFALAATDGSLITRVRRILGRQSETRHELPPSWGILVLLMVVGGGAGTYEMSADAANVAEIARAAAQPTTVPVLPLAAPAESYPTLASDTLPAEPQEPRQPLPTIIELTEPEVVNQLPPAPPEPPTPPAPPTQGRLNIRPAPSAPAARSAPAAPSAPSAPSQSSGNFVWSNDNERLTVKWTGEFRLSDDEQDIAWVEDGATLTIADGWVFTDRVEFRGLAGGKVERRYYRSGFQREIDAEGRAFVSGVIQRMIRGGLFASERVARILKQGGPDAVLAEVDRLKTTSSHVKRVYYSALLKQADLTTPQLVRLLDRVTTTINSDHEKRLVLTQILNEPGVTDEHRALAARAAARMSSDHEQRLVLTAALATDAPSAAVIDAVLDGLEGVSSNHERSLVLIDVARKGGVNERTSARFMDRVTAMSSGYEQRKVLSALALNPKLAAAVARDSLEAVAVIASSHDKAEILLQVVAKAGVADDSAPTFFTTVDGLNSSHEQSRVLNALLARGRMSDSVLTAFLRTTTGISSSYERSRVLLGLLKVQPLTGNHRTLFLEAAETIPSKHEQDQVLAALVRAERR
jgi:beta-lactamase regulating signal transducer with metallopeptidase domain